MQWNFCPFCGHRTYQHDGTRCTHTTQVHHIVRVTSEGWTLKHPLAEREKDALFDCKIHADLQTVTGWPQPGDYAIMVHKNNGWAFEPASKATEPCDCTYDSSPR